MKLYKLTDEKGQSYGNMQWGEGVSHSATGNGDNLCSSDFIHAYQDPLLAIILNPIHANFKNPKLWEAEGEITKRDGTLKVGCKSLKTIKEIPVPQITTEQRITFAIYCALEVYKAPKFVTWANNWLEDKDRSAAAADAAAAAADAAYAAYAAYAAARAAAAAARDAAYAAAYAAADAAAADAAAAYAAAAADAAAAYAYAYAAAELNLILIAHKAWSQGERAEAI